MCVKPVASPWALGADSLAHSKAFGPPLPVRKRCVWEGDTARGPAGIRRRGGMRPLGCAGKGAELPRWWSREGLPPAPSFSSQAPPPPSAGRRPWPSEQNPARPRLPWGTTQVLGGIFATPTSQRNEKHVRVVGLPRVTACQAAGTGCHRQGGLSSKCLPSHHPGGRAFERTGQPAQVLAGGLAQLGVSTRKGADPTPPS